MNHFIHTLQSADIEVDAQNLRRRGGNCEWDSFKKKSNLKQFCELQWQRQCKSTSKLEGKDRSNIVKDEPSVWELGVT